MEKKEQHYDNGTAFTFISNCSGHLDKTPMELKKSVFEAIQARHHALDWEKITHAYQGYLKIHGKIHVDEFVFNYVLGHSLLNEYAWDDIKKEAMYLHLRTELMTKKEKTGY